MIRSIKRVQNDILMRHPIVDVLVNIDGKLYRNKIRRNLGISITSINNAISELSKKGLVLNVRDKNRRVPVLTQKGERVCTLICLLMSELEDKNDVLGMV